jgi:hypothetical protein
MTGEPVTISNIERKVRENLKMFRINWKTLITINGNQIKTGAGRLGNSFGDFVMTVFKVFAKF